MWDGGGSEPLLLRPPVEHALVTGCRPASGRGSRVPRAAGYCRCHSLASRHPEDSEHLPGSPRGPGWGDRFPGARILAPVNSGPFLRNRGDAVDIQIKKPGQTPERSPARLAPYTSPPISFLPLDLWICDLSGVDPGESFGPATPERSSVQGSVVDMV